MNSLNNGVLPATGKPKINTIESVVLTAQMAARREALQRILCAPTGWDDALPQPTAGNAAVAAREAARETMGQRHESTGRRSQQPLPHATSVNPTARANMNSPATHLHTMISVIGQGLLQNWWQAHPARVATQLARNLLAEQARAHPKRLLAAGAILGATVVLLKPWRRIHVSKLLLGALAGGSTGVLAKLLGTDNSENSTPPRSSRDSR